MLSPAEYYHLNQFGIREIQNPFTETQLDLAHVNQFTREFLYALDASNMVDVLTSYASVSPEQVGRMFQGDAAPATDLLERLSPEQTHLAYVGLGRFHTNQNQLGMVAQLVHHYTRYSTIEDSQNINDQVAGLDHRERKAGNPKISSLFNRRITQSALKVSRLDAQTVNVEFDPDTVSTLTYKVKTSTHLPSLNMFHGYVVNTNGDQSVREVMMDVIERQAHDIYLAARKIQIMGASVGLRREVGMDTDSYLAAFGFTSAEYIRNRIVGSFRNPAFKDEYHRRLAISAPQTYLKLKSGQAITYQEVLNERAQWMGLPEEFPSQPDLEAAAKQVQKRVADSTMLSIQSKDDQEYIGPRIITPLTSERAGNVVYKNKDGKDVETITLDPYRQKDVVRQVGHENGHKDHYDIATRMLEVSPETSLTWEENTHKETIADVKGDAVAEVIDHPLAKGIRLSDKDDIEVFMRAARMGLTGLNQLYIQEELDKYENPVPEQFLTHKARIEKALEMKDREEVDIDEPEDLEQGYHKPQNLTLEAALAIAQEVEERTNSLVQDIFGMERHMHTGAANTITPEFLLDGVVYTGLVEGLIQDKITLKTVIEKKLGTTQWWNTQIGQLHFNFMAYLTTQKGLTADDIIYAVQNTPTNVMTETLGKFGITVRPQEAA